MIEQKTDLRQFPASMHHLIRHVVEGEERKVYSVGRVGNYREVRVEQCKKYPYEVVDIKVIPAGGAPGAVVHADFRNKITGELDQTSLPDNGEELIEGLEHKLEIRSSESRQKFWRTGDYDLNNQYLERFRGVEVTGIAIEQTSENDTKHYRLIGILI